MVIWLLLYVLRICKANLCPESFNIFFFPSEKFTVLPGRRRLVVFSYHPLPPLPRPSTPLRRSWSFTNTNTRPAIVRGDVLYTSPVFRFYQTHKFELSFMDIFNFSITWLPPLFHGRVSGLGRRCSGEIYTERIQP